MLRPIARGRTRGRCVQSDAITLHSLRLMQRGLPSRHLAHEDEAPTHLIRPAAAVAGPQTRRGDAHRRRGCRSRIHSTLPYWRRHGDPTARAQSLCSRCRSLALCRWRHFGVMPRNILNSAQCQAYARTAPEVARKSYRGPSINGITTMSPIRSARDLSDAPPASMENS